MIAKQFAQIETEIRKTCKQYSLTYIQTREIYWKPKAAAMLASLAQTPSKGTKMIAYVDKQIRRRTSYIQSNLAMEILLLAIQTHNPMFYFPHYIAAVNIYAPMMPRIPIANADEIISIIMGITDDEEGVAAAWELLRKRYSEQERHSFTFPHETYGLKDFVANSKYPPMTLAELHTKLMKTFNVDVPEPKDLESLAQSLSCTFCIIDASVNVKHSTANLIPFPNRLADLMRASANPIKEPIQLFEEVLFAEKAAELYTQKGHGKKYMLLLVYGERYIVLGRSTGDEWAITFASPPSFDKPQAHRYSLLPNLIIHEVMKHHQFLKGDVENAIEVPKIIEQLISAIKAGASEKAIAKILARNASPTSLEKVSYVLAARKILDAAEITEEELHLPTSPFMYTVSNYLEGFLRQ